MAQLCAAAQRVRNTAVSKSMRNSMKYSSDNWQKDCVKKGTNIYEKKRELHDNEQFERHKKVFFMPEKELNKKKDIIKR